MTHRSRRCPGRIPFLLTALALGGGCPASPGTLDPPTASTAVAVGTYRLVPASTVAYQTDFTYVMVTDLADGCPAIATVPACRPEGWLASRALMEPPGAARTSLVLGLSGTSVGTYEVSTWCYGGYAPFAKASFVVHDAAGQAVLRLHAVAGTVVLWKGDLAGGVSGIYDLLLDSGERIQGAFLGQFCAAFGPYASPGSISGNVSSSGGTVNETCSCAGNTAASACQRGTGGDWSCQCTLTDGSSSSCALPAGSVPPVCPEQWFTCCPMCP